MKPNSLIIRLLAFFAPLFLIAQNARPEMKIRRAADKIRIDGALDEAAWRDAEMVTGFEMNFPEDGKKMAWQTEARLAFDDENLYAAFVCYQKKEDYTVQSYRRDFPGGTSDVINLMLDPFRDGQNGFLFSVNPLNVQREALMSSGDQFANIWDNKWRSAVENHDDRWVVEMAIPFRSIRYKLAPEGQPNRWRVNFLRTKLKNFEVGNWAPVPRNNVPQNLAFCGELEWLEAPPAPGANISVIPYLTGGFSREYPRGADLKKLDPKDVLTRNAGLDAKIGVTPSLNLDLTVNPDFSQVEVDRQVANLSRFELFFPETRQFFLENQDLFGMFGFPSTRPFFSRRIGLARNPTTGLNEKVPIFGGARLSGKIDSRTRIGLLNMTSARRDWDSTAVLPAANFTTVSLQRRLFARSTVGLIYVDKTNFLGQLNDAQKAPHEPWNRVAGIEYNLYSKDNRWEGEWYYHRSFSPDAGKRDHTFAHFLGYNDRHGAVRLGYMNVGKNYTADAGFVPRRGIQAFYPSAAFRFYPKTENRLTEKTSLFELGLEGGTTLDAGGKFLDGNLDPYFLAQFKQQGVARAGFYFDRTYLFAPFDLNLGGSDQPLPIGDYRFWGANAEVATGTSNDLQGGLALEAGEYFLGKYASIDANAALRTQPVGLFTLTANYTRIRQPAPYPSGSFFLIGPKAEISFRRDLFLSAFFQWNTQANNFNVNARLQWRFAPVSDVFLVYTDNSFAKKVDATDIRFFAPKGRAIVFKAVYWLNV